MSAPFLVHEGTTSLVVSIPHVGHHFPGDLAERLRPSAIGTSDADWHVDRLYGFVQDMGASLIVAGWSRWYIDLNRPLDNSSLYPGQATTGLCPTERFDGGPLYREGCAPGPAEVADRVQRCWAPYHRELERLIEAVRSRHGRATLLDAHSIVSVCPRLFEGRLPDVNIGTNGGSSCSPDLRERVRDALREQDGFSWVVDGRFRGGHITRHYGRPSEGIDAIQIELAQSAYMDESEPAQWDEQRAKPLQALLRRIVVRLSA